MASLVRVLLRGASEHAGAETKASWDKKDVSALSTAMSQDG